MVIINPMRIIIFGATGTVGAEVVRQGILDPAVEEITAIVRRPLEISDPKLKVIEHQNYMDFSALRDTLKNQDACLWCLGVSQSQVSEQEYITITYGYALAAAKEVLNNNPNGTFVFLSGEGADQNEKSFTLFGRIKGRTEKVLLQLPFKKIYIARPAGIQPIHLNKNTSFFNKLVVPFFPLLKLIAPAMVITSVQLADALLSIAKNGYKKTIIENKDLLEIARLAP
jgi:uncharacterized protein YbjT (DUF2867 family)